MWFNELNFTLRTVDIISVFCFPTISYAIASGSPGTKTISGVFFFLLAALWTRPTCVDTTCVYRRVFICRYTLYRCSSHVGVSRWRQIPAETVSVNWQVVQKTYTDPFLAAQVRRGSSCQRLDCRGHRRADCHASRAGVRHARGPRATGETNNFHTSGHPHRYRVRVQRQHTSRPILIRRPASVRIFTPSITYFWDTRTTIIIFNWRVASIVQLMRHPRLGRKLCESIKLLFCRAIRFDVLGRSSYLVVNGSIPILISIRKIRCSSSESVGNRV